nr:UL16-binding protein 3-like [Saimiri boliviensis boliviensis]
MEPPGLTTVTEFEITTETKTRPNCRVFIAGGHGGLASLQPWPQKEGVKTFYAHQEIPRWRSTTGRQCGCFDQCSCFASTLAWWSSMQNTLVEVSLAAPHNNAAWEDPDDSSAGLRIDRDSPSLRSRTLMAAATSPAFLLCLALLLLLSGWSRAQCTDAHSLCYNFTITHLPRSGQRWCEVQGQVDQKNFLSYDCGTDKVFSVGRLEEQLNATDAWERQLEMLREVGQTLRLELPGIELEDFTPSGPVTLQARMSCECEADGHIQGSWQFEFHGQKFLLFDSNNRKWTVVHAGARQMKEKWEEDRELTVFFWKISTGDCGSWLRDFLMCREKRQEPTAPPTVSSGTVPLRAVATTLMLCYLFFILLCCLLTGN